MKRPHASNDVRERALAALDDGQSVVDVAKFFQNDPSTIYRWRRRRQATGSGLARPRSGRPPLLSSAHHTALAAQVAASPDATLAGHCTRWWDEHGIRVSLSTMSRRVRDLGFTLKKRP